jgi:hypothetical protein
MGSPTSRTLEALRKDGWKAQVVEHWNPHVKRRKDLFDCIDVLAIRGEETLGVQACAVSSQAARMAKAVASEGAAAWLAGGNRRLEVWGWGKKKLKRGGKAMRWHVTVRPVALSELPAEREAT